MKPIMPILIILFVVGIATAQIELGSDDETGLSLQTTAPVVGGDGILCDLLDVTCTGPGGIGASSPQAPLTYNPDTGNWTDNQGIFLNSSGGGIRTPNITFGDGAFPFSQTYGNIRGDENLNLLIESGFTGTGQLTLRQFQLLLSNYYDPGLADNSTILLEHEQSGEFNASIIFDHLANTWHFSPALPTSGGGAEPGPWQNNSNEASLRTFLDTVVLDQGDEIELFSGQIGSHTFGEMDISDLVGINITARGGEDSDFILLSSGGNNYILNGTGTIAEFPTYDLAIYEDGSELKMTALGNPDEFLMETENTRWVLYDSPSSGNDYKAFEAFSKQAGDQNEFVITQAGPAHTSYFFRSLSLVGNGSQIGTPFNCTTFAKHVDCSTDGTGPDFYVLDDIELNGTIYPNQNVSIGEAYAVSGDDNTYLIPYASDGWELVGGGKTFFRYRFDQLGVDKFNEFNPFNADLANIFNTQTENNTYYSEDGYNVFGGTAQENNSDVTINGGLSVDTQIYSDGEQGYTGFSKGQWRNSTFYCMKFNNGILVNYVPGSSSC